MIYKPYTYSDNFKLNEHIGNIINNYLYDDTFSTIPINIKKLIGELTKINTILNKNLFMSNFSARSLQALSKSKKNEISIFKMNDKDIIKNIKKINSKKKGSKKRSSKKRSSKKRSSKKRSSKKRSSKKINLKNIKRRLREKTKKRLRKKSQQKSKKK